MVTRAAKIDAELDAYIAVEAARNGQRYSSMLRDLAALGRSAREAAALRVADEPER